MSLLESWSGGTPPTTIGSVTVDETVGVPTQLDAPALRIESTGSAAHARWSFAAQTTVAFGFFIRTPTAWGSSSVSIAALRLTAGATTLGIALSGTAAPGALRLTKTGGTIILQSPNNTLELDSEYYIYLFYNSVENSAYVEIRPVGSHNLLWWGEVVDAALSTSVTIVDLGRITSATMSEFWVDSISIGSDPWDLPHTTENETFGPATNPNQVWVWDGIGPIVGAVYVWDGIALQPALGVYVWDGANLLPTI